MTRELKTIVLLACLWLCASCSTTPCAPADHPGFAPCRALMAEQQAAWNRGDIKAFAEGYKKSPHLVFAGKTSVDLGFDQMLARYLRSYPTAERMGQLEFSDLHFSSLGEDELTCRGAWRLQRSTDAPHGWFVLVFARFPEGWRIVLDYTSSAS